MKSRIGILALILGATASLNVGITKQKLYKGAIPIVNPHAIALVKDLQRNEAMSKMKEMKVCDDCIGTLEIENSEVMFQIVQGQDNEFYLDHDINKMESVYGSAFLDYRNDLNDMVLFLYGHHMSDGEMFAQLLHYEDDEYLENHRSITFLTEQWRVVASGKVNDEQESDLFVAGYNKILNDEHFLRYIKYLEEVLGKQIDIGDSKQLLILSTCFEIGSDERYFVVVKKV